MKELIRKVLPALLLLAGTHLVQAQQAHVNLDWNPQKNDRNLLPFGASVISPEGHDDRRSPRPQGRRALAK